MSIQFRRATAMDFEAIANIYNEHIQLGKSSMDESLKNPMDIDSWVNNFHEREALFVGEVDNKIVGWGIIKRYSDRTGYRFCAETAIYLWNKDIGKGYGTAFKKMLIKEAKKMDYHHLIAKIFTTNKASIAYNQKLGYELVGIQKEIGWKNNQWVDIAILQYIIK